MYVYHATYRANLNSIKKLGLGAKQPKNWDFSLDNVICLGKDPEDCVSFCECAENVSDSKYESGIVVFAISVKDLNMKLLIQDPNLKNNTSYIYSGIIEPKKLNVLTENRGLVGNLLDLKRVPAYDK